MATATRAAEVRRAVDEAHARGMRVGFVPTMGFLHEGHLRLVDDARARAQFTVVSIFVNPLQFGAGEDFTRYPRDAEGDAAKAGDRGVDLLFTPEVSEIYPAPQRVTVSPGALAARWEGEMRPGHFAGVLTVVAKLFGIVRPDVALFGQKDFQQAALVRAMVRDLNIPVDVVVHPTVRELDGLALSSRNSYLDASERRRALVLSRSLRAVRSAWRDGTCDAPSLLGAANRVLAEEPEIRVEYVALADPNTLDPVDPVPEGTVAMIAARVGATRLIDNMVLDAG